MFDPRSTRRAWEPVAKLPQTLMLAAGLGLLAFTVAWAAPPAASNAAAAAPEAKPGASCPVPEPPNAADGSLRGFTRHPTLYLEVDGKEVPAEIYRIGSDALLMISPKLPTPLVLKGWIVAAVPPGKIDKRPDGSVDVRRDAELKRLGSYSATYDTVTFEVAGHREVARMRPLGFLRPDGAPSSQRRR